MRNRSEQTELATAFVIVLAEAVAITLFISAVAVWAVIIGGA